VAMKAPKEWPDPPEVEQDKILSDEEAVKLLDEFLHRSYDKGYAYLGHGFEELMQSIHVAITWYHELYGKE
jgi:hypothetical protein